MVNWQNVYEAEMKSILRRVILCEEIGDVEGYAFWIREMEVRQNRGAKPL